MKPLDFSLATWESLQPQIDGHRRAVYYAWQRHGPGTTRAVAERAELDLLTFRPRTTELFQLGLILLEDPSHPAKEGTYRARTREEWITWFEAQKAQFTLGRQPFLPHAAALDGAAPSAPHTTPVLSVNS